MTDLNRQRGGTYSWRLPNINELESLVDCSAHSPALPHGHPFRDVQGRILVFNDEHVRTGLGLGALSHQRGSRRSDRKGARISQFGRCAISSSRE